MADSFGSRVPNHSVVIAFVQVNWQVRQRDAGHSPAKVAAAVPRVSLKVDIRFCGAEEMHHHTQRVPPQLGTVRREGPKIAPVDVE